MGKADATLSQFGKHALALTEWLEHNPELGLVDQIFIENHIHVLRLAYTAWKLRHPHELNRSELDSY